MGVIPITDGIFLLAERPTQPMHVGGLQVFRSPDGAGPDWVARLYEQMLAGSEIASLFRRRADRSIRTAGAWVWVDDVEIDLEHHVRHSALPRPGRVRELLALVSQLHGTRLDRHRPLWEVHVIEGLDDNRFAIYTKVHHALVDGVAALRLLGAGLSRDPDAVVAPLWAARPGGDKGAAKASASIDASGSDTSAPLSAGALRVVGELADIGPTLGRRVVRTLLAGAGQLDGAPPHTMLNVAVSGSRRYAAQSWPLERVRGVATALDATVNDIVLAMCSAALRSYLVGFDALPAASLAALAPVSLRDGSAAEGGGNALGAIVADLGTDQIGVDARLDVIRASMARGKDELAGLTSLQATALGALVMAPLALASMGPLGRLAPLPFNVVISNLRGPTETLFYNGARLEGLYPLSIPFDGQALNITVTSYRGSLDFGLTGDRRALPHLQRLLGHLDAGLEELVALAGL